MTTNGQPAAGLARLALETNVDLEQLGVALAALNRLPQDPDRSVEVLAQFAAG